MQTPGNSPAISPASVLVKWTNLQIILLAIVGKHARLQIGTSLAAYLARERLSTTIARKWFHSYVDTHVLL